MEIARRRVVPFSFLSFAAVFGFMLSLMTSHNCQINFYVAFIPKATVIINYYSVVPLLLHFWENQINVSVFINAFDIFCQFRYNLHS